MLGPSGDRWKSMCVLCVVFATMDMTNSRPYQRYHNTLCADLNLARMQILLRPLHPINGVGRGARARRAERDGRLLA